MLRISYYLLLLTGLAVCFGPAAGAAGNSASGRFQPALSVSKDSALCAPFRDAWRALFQSAAPLDEDRMNLAAIYPSGKTWSYPPDSADGLYDKTYVEKVDFDGDGEIEVLHVEGDQLGWRYLGASVYLFDSERDYETALKSGARQGPRGLTPGWGDEPVPASYRKIARYAPTGVIQILRLDGRFYSMLPPTIPTETEPKRVNLVRLRADDMPELVCSVELFPPKNHFAAFRERSILFRNLHDIYGRGRNRYCLGTMGWTAPPVDSLLPTLFYRPHVLTEGKIAPRIEPAEDTSREVRFLVRGLSDPQSWQDYLDMKSGRDSFLRKMQNHYRSHFSYTDEESWHIAELAWRALLDGVIYARNPDSFTLTAMVRLDEKFRLSPDATPHEIGRGALAAWRKEIETGSTLGAYRREVISPQAMLAAVYTGQPLDMVAWSFEQLDRILNLTVDNVRHDDVRYEKARRRVMEKRKTFLNEALLAALRDPVLTKFFLDRGADPNAHTNWFGKTPLMYAAQQNRRAAVDRLLTGGADVNARTDGSEYQCSELDRDGRTALMYAAENATADLIERLVKAGADVTARDSKGNTVIWYFGRNTLETRAARRKTIKALLTR